MRESWKRRLWIVDGHNAIFAIRELSTLQVAGQTQEARRGLEFLLRPFARRLLQPLVVVYDGNRLLPNPDAAGAGELRTLYSQPPEEADDRIAYLAADALGRGRTVVVVSNDRRSLGARLAPGALMMGVAEFRERCLRPDAVDDDGVTADGREPEPARADFADVEQHFLERQGEIARMAQARARRLEQDARRRWIARTQPHSAGTSQERTTRDETAGGGEGWHSAEPRWSRTDGRRSRGPASAPRAPAKAPPPPAPAAPAPPHESLTTQQARARDAKRKRGQRKQARRLDQMRRSGQGKARRRK